MSSTTTAAAVSPTDDELNMFESPKQIFLGLSTLDQPRLVECPIKYLAIGIMHCYNTFVNYEVKWQDTTIW